MHGANENKINLFLPSSDFIAQMCEIIFRITVTPDTKTIFNRTLMTSSTLNNKTPNSLIHESSPYLLQHAYNPVDWMGWSADALRKAEANDKLILVSIGYSACHWCHVMEKECFEDNEVAELMNRHFINIKVDREERPDIDHIYMDAVQLMTGRGGWPLNCFLLPDGRPIYGGTYFPKKQWINVLQSLQELWQNEKSRAYEYAENLLSGLQKMDVVKPSENELDVESQIHRMVQNWKKNLDPIFGGPDKAPKFPMPCNYEFLMHYAHLYHDEALMKHVELTLEQMAWGGIYDQIGGGFARYSTDKSWKVPHFEKMLYDNGQLLGLYAEAYALHKKPLYREIAEGIIAFCKQELFNGEGAFYSALDADSEGEEGKFYVWTQEEIQNILGQDYEIAGYYYNLNPEGYWENGNYILLRNQSDEACAQHFNLDLQAFKTKIQSINDRLLHARNKRPRPGLDDKTLTSWNAMLAKGLAVAAAALQNNDYLNTAKDILTFIENKLTDKQGKLFRNYKNGKHSIPAFLEDYAHFINANIAVYQACFEEKYLNKAYETAQTCINLFYDEAQGYFTFNSAAEEQLIIKKFEITDNVIPASNSVMARNLFILGQYFGRIDLENIAEKMLKNVLPAMEHYGAAYSNWGILALWQSAPFHHLVICGPGAKEKIIGYQSGYYPQCIAAVSHEKSELPIFNDRWVAGQTWVYHCENKSCQMPVNEIDYSVLLPKVKK